jgi:hypothetical protein
MVWTDLIALIPITAIIGLIVWLFPLQTAKLILIMLKRFPPSKPSEIQNYIDQFLKNNGWKKFTAEGMLGFVFDRKIKEYKKHEIEQWEELIDKIEIIPIKNAINEINDELEKMKSPKIINGQQIQVFADEKAFISKNLEKRLEIYEQYFSENKNVSIWRFEEMSFGEIGEYLELESTSMMNQANKMPMEDRLRSSVYYPPVVNGKVVNYGHTTKDIGRMLWLRNTVLIEVNGHWTHQLRYNGDEIPSKETFLKEHDFKEPVKLSKVEIKNIFDRILSNINIYENFKLQQNNLTWALSDKDESIDIFKTIIKNYLN